MKNECVRLNNQNQISINNIYKVGKKKKKETTSVYHSHELHVSMSEPASSDADSQADSVNVSAHD
jgi:hypothetical protein